MRNALPAIEPGADGLRRTTRRSFTFDSDQPGAYLSALGVPIAPANPRAGLERGELVRQGQPVFFLAPVSPMWDRHDPSQWHQGQH